LKIKNELLFLESTPWGNLEVWQKDSVRSLYIRDKKAIQSQLDMAKKEKLLLPHTRAMMSFLLFKPEPQSVLLFGLGGGGIIHFLCHWFPELKIVVVDINEKVVDIGKKYFALSATPLVSIEIADAATYIKNTKQENINVILVDVHNGDCLPDFLYDHAFMAQCFHALSSGGVLVINVLINNEQDFTDILIALREIFIDVSLCMAFKNQRNILLFAFKTPGVLDINQLRARAIQCQKKYGIEFEEFIDGVIKIDAK